DITVVLFRILKKPDLIQKEHLLFLFNQMWLFLVLSFYLKKHMIKIIYNNYVLAQVKDALALGHGSIGKETAPAGANSGTVYSDVCGQICRVSLGSIQIRLWLKPGEPVDFSSCADYETE
uniref:Uncharacterized protein n=1 Tax=Amazona collaria TaxID=241587 RepID=A0A8B9F831_9PSIT